MAYMSVDLRILLHYKFVFIILLFRFGYIFFYRKRFKLIKERVPRPSSDATWFLPAYVWGIESLKHVVWWHNQQRLNDFIYYQMGRIEHGFFSAFMFVFIIGLCFLQEYFARYIGMGVRENQSTIPISLIAVFLGVGSIWILIGLNIPFPLIIR